MQKKIKQPVQSELLLNMARHRVAKGVQWLDQQAKTDPRFRGWRLEMISIHGGRVASHVRIEERGTDEPLALIFKWYPEFADPSDGRVRGFIVREALGISDEQATDYGFYEGIGFTYGGTDVLRRTITEQAGEVWDAALNQAWEEALGEYRNTTASYVGWKNHPEPPLGFFGRLLAGWIQSSGGRKFLR